MELADWDKFIRDTEHSYMSLALRYGFDLESAKDLTYDTYISILENYKIPTFNLGVTILTNKCKNIIRNKSRGVTDEFLVYECDLPDFFKHKGMHLDMIADAPATTDPWDFNEVLSVMQTDLHGDDYAIVMMRGFNYPYKKIAKKFKLSVGQVKRRIRFVRRYLNYKFPDLFS